MHTLIYTKVNDQSKAIPKLKELRENSKDRASARVVEFWQGEVERCDQMLYGEGCEKVADAYKYAGTTVKALFEKSKKVEDVKHVDQVVETVVGMVTEPTPEPIAQDQPKRRGRPGKE